MALTITIPGGPVQLAGTNIRVNVNSDTIQGTLYQLLLKITLEVAGQPIAGFPAIEVKVPNASGNAEFQISGYFEEVPIPDFLITAGTIYTEREAYKFSFDIGETYIDEQGVRQENWSGLTGSQYEVLIIQGGLTQHQQNIYTEEGTTWYADFIQGGKWLTTLPSPLAVSPEKLVKLWYITPEATQQNLTLKADYILKDGTTGTASNAVTINPGYMGEFNVDPVTLGLDVSSANPVVSYEVYLANGATQVNEKHLFEIDYTYFEEISQVFYSTKYGGVDAIWLTGKVTDALPANHETAQRTPQITDTTKNRTQVMVTKSGRQKWDLNSGHKSYPEIMALRHLILSTQIWLLQGSYVMPVSIENSREVLAAIYNNIHDFPIELIAAHNDKY